MNGISNAGQSPVNQNSFMPIDTPNKSLDNSQVNTKTEQTPIGQMLNDEVVTFSQIQGSEYSPAQNADYTKKALKTDTPPLKNPKNTGGSSSAANKFLVSISSVLTSMMSALGTLIRKMKQQEREASADLTQTISKGQVDKGETQAEISELGAIKSIVTGVAQGAGAAASTGISSKSLTTSGKITPDMSKADVAKLSGQASAQSALARSVGEGTSSLGGIAGSGTDFAKAEKEKELGYLEGNLESLRSLNDKTNENVQAMGEQLNKIIDLLRQTVKDMMDAHKIGNQ